MIGIIAGTRVLMLGKLAMPIVRLTHWNGFHVRMRAIMCFLMLALQIFVQTVHVALNVHISK